MGKAQLSVSSKNLTLEVPVFANRSNYLKKPVTQKSKMGEDNFLILVQHLLYDLEDFESVKEYLAWYMAITLNLYMHNSTYNPATGYGKVQLREMETPLKYFRSQLDHPHRMVFDKLVKTKGLLGKGYLPRNEDFVKQLTESEFAPVLTKAINTLDEKGFPKNPNIKKPKNLGPELGHSGARANNFSTYVTGLRGIPDRIAAFKSLFTEKKLKKIAKKARKQDNNTLTESIESLYTSFKALKQTVPSTKIIPNLNMKIARQRTEATQFICQKASEQKFKYLSVNTTPGSNCITIDLYPKFTDKIKDTQNYAEGVTNTLISFFAGLLNHYAQSENLFLHTERRQSFGFLRPTVTDVGSLSIRLSLGLEPTSYNDIIHKSLNALDQILGKYDFTQKVKNPKNLSNEEQLIAECFVFSEAAKRKDENDKDIKTEKTGRRILSAMRSDHDKIDSAIEAHYYLNKNESKNDTSYYYKAFETYLKKIVIDYEKHTKPDDIKESTELNTFKTKTKTDPSTVIFDLLQNTLNYGIRYVEQIAKPSDDNPILFNNSYNHTLQKLYNNCDKACYLLKNLGEYEESHLYAKANLLIENMLEYLISLDALEQIRMDENNIENEPIQTLHDNEIENLSKLFIINKKSLNVFFTDSGQQANIAAIMAMEMQAKMTNANNKRDASVYLSDNCYYELNSFFDKNKGIITGNKNQATVVVLDMTQIDKFKLDEFPKLKSVIIDTTHFSSLNNDKLKSLIQQLQKKNYWTVLTSSLLKHGELGLDKYQAGSITIIEPPHESLESNLRDELQNISETAMDPAIASYFNIVQSITQKIPTTNSSLQEMSLFNSPHYKTYEQGLKLLDKANKQDANGKDLSESEEFSDLCETIEQLSISDPKLGSKLREEAAPLQQSFCAL